MKPDIHPKYQEVCFFDVSADFKLITRSTASSNETIEVDGKEYPLIKVPISSASHPFFTGKSMFVDSTGRVEKFQKKFANWRDRRKGAKKEG